MSLKLDQEIQQTGTRFLILPLPAYVDPDVEPERVVISVPAESDWARPRRRADVRRRCGQHASVSRSSDDHLPVSQRRHAARAGGTFRSSDTPERASSPSQRCMRLCDWSSISGRIYFGNQIAWSLRIGLRASWSHSAHRVGQCAIRLRISRIRIWAHADGQHRS